MHKENRAGENIYYQIVVISVIVIEMRVDDDFCMNNKNLVKCVRKSISQNRRVHGVFKANRAYSKVPHTRRIKIQIEFCEQHTET